MAQRLRTSQAFTLWELLAILVILAVTAAILFPIFARPQRHPRQQICSSNLKQVGLALLAYTQDYDEKFPPAFSQIITEDGSVHEQELGAAIGDASGRHAGGVYYLFADGHVKWMKPDVVFFPLRTSNSSSHREAGTGRLLGPDPAGAAKNDMTFAGKIYTATFHLR